MLASLRNITKPGIVRTCRYLAMTAEQRSGIQDKVKAEKVVVSENFD